MSFSVTQDAPLFERGERRVSHEAKDNACSILGELWRWLAIQLAACVLRFPESY